MYCTVLNDLETRAKASEPANQRRRRHALYNWRFGNVYQDAAVTCSLLVV